MKKFILNIILIIIVIFLTVCNNYSSGSSKIAPGADTTPLVITLLGDNPILLNKTG